MSSAEMYRCLYICACTCVCVCTNAYTYVCVYVYVYMPVCVYVCIHACVLVKNLLLSNKYWVVNSIYLPWFRYTYKIHHLETVSMDPNFFFLFIYNLGGVGAGCWVLVLVMMLVLLYSVLHWLTIRNKNFVKEIGKKIGF